MSDTTREVFLAERRRGLGGSDIAAVLGIDPRKTAYQLWREKIGLDRDEANNPACLRRGNFLEPAILTRYAEVVKPASIEAPIAHHADGGWRRGNQDARAIMANGTRRAVEAKSVNRHVFRSDWGAPWSDEVPDRALCQGFWYGNLDDADIIDFALCVVPDDPDEVLGLAADEVLAISEFHIFQAPRNRVIEQDLIETAHAFWHVNVLQKIEPEIMPDDLALRWPRHITGEVRPGEAVLDLIKRYEEYCEVENLAKKERKSLREQLLLYAQGAEALVAPDGATPWLTMRTEERPAHAVPASTARVLRFTKWWKRRAIKNPTTQPTTLTQET